MISEPAPPQLSSLPVAARSLSELDRLQIAARQCVAAQRQAIAISSVVEADALLLGALQREAGVSQRFGLAELPRARRLTTGVSARLSGGALHHLLLLPQVDHLIFDAHSGNFINRYVRGLLAGYNALGAPAHYFGREHFSLAKRPAGVLGVDVTSGGVWILEAWVGLNLPAALSEFRGAAPVALREVLASAGSARADAPAQALAERAHERMCRAWLSAQPGGAPSQLTESTVLDRAAALGDGAAAVGELPKPPLPALADDQRWRRVEVPIGWLEVGVGEGQRTIRGDMLTSRAAVSRAEAALAGRAVLDVETAERALAAFEGLPFEGARLSDLLELLVEA